MRGAIIAAPAIVGLICLLSCGTAVAARLDKGNLKECIGKPYDAYMRFYPELFDPIYKGTKRATSRMGVRCFDAGSIIPMTDMEKKPAGLVRIEKSLLTTWDAISEDVAKAEGTTAERLKAGLLSIYGEAIKTSGVTVVYFRYAGKPRQ